MKKLILNSQLIYALILFNVIVIYLQSFQTLSPYHLYFELIDAVITLFFCVEITYKIIASSPTNKIKTYFKNPWNRIDFISILFALPSIGVYFMPTMEIFAGFSILRSLRIFKLLRVIEFIPNGKRLSTQLFKALQGVSFIIFSFFVYTTIISLISLTLFKDVAPMYFQNAFDSFLTIFKVFSGDGFSDILIVIQSNSSSLLSAFAKFYFVAIVFSGSILGISLINSVFIDQMNQNISKTDKKEINEIQNLKKDLEVLKKQQNEILNLLKEKS
jgi:voltage-gated sodium channel